MDPLVIASPHLDDAVLSCGQFMAGRADTTVVTVFAGWPDVGAALTDFDHRSGFTSSDAAVRSRRIEDGNATRLLRADSEHLLFIDNQYVSDEDRQDTATRGPVLIDEISEQLVRRMEQIGAQELLGPVGLLHPDHVATSEAVLQLVDVYDVWLYEELPSRVLWPELTASRLANIGERFDVELQFIGEGPMTVKARAVHCYASQQWALDRRCLFVPERFHRVTAR